VLQARFGTVATFVENHGQRERRRPKLTVERRDCETRRPRHQATNFEAERNLAAIRIRAERRAGELLKDMQANGDRARGRPKKVSPQATLSKLGIAREQSSKWQQLAAIPKDKFE